MHISLPLLFHYTLYKLIVSDLKKSLLSDPAIRVLRNNSAGGPPE